MSSGEVLSTARLRDPQARCPLVAIFCRPHPMFRNTSALLRGAITKANITQHSALRPDDGHITSIAIQQSHSVNVAIKRVVVVLLWALPTPRAAECVALPTESAAKDGRCLHGQEVRDKVFSKTGGGLEKYFLHVAYWGTTFFRSTILRLCEVRPSQLDVPSGNARTHWWTHYCTGIDESFFESGLIARGKRTQGGKTNYFHHTTQPLRRKSS